jgi:hypothetical protein
MGILLQAHTRSVSVSRMQPFRIWMSLYVVVVLER